LRRLLRLWMRRCMSSHTKNWTLGGARFFQTKLANSQDGVWAAMSALYSDEVFKLPSGFWNLQTLSSSPLPGSTVARSGAKAV